MHEKEEKWMDIPMAKRGGARAEALKKEGFREAFQGPGGKTRVKNP